jgi:hypothetical protein
MKMKRPPDAPSCASRTQVHLPVTLHRWSTLDVMDKAGQYQRGTPTTVDLRAVFGQL